MMNAYTPYPTLAKITDPLSSFGELLTSERTPIIELNSAYGISNLRDIVWHDGAEQISARDSVRVSAFEGRHKVTTPATAGSSTILDSAERGRYMPGYDAQMGIGVQGDIDLVGDQEREWGYFDENNGFFFREKAGKTFSIHRLRNGIEKESVSRAQWSVDKLDGTGPSKLKLSELNGYIFQIKFVHYGFGPINFNVCFTDKEGLQQVITVHRISDPTATSVIDPNLPIRLRLKNNTTAIAQSTFVSGRQFSVGGKYMPHFRTTGDSVLNKALTTAFTPILSFRRKAGFKGVRVLPGGYDLSSSAEIQLEIRVNGVLAGAVYGNLERYSPSETALERDVSATGITGGEAVFSAMHQGGVGNTKEIGSKTVDGIVIPSTRPITILARTTSGTGTVSVTKRLLEEW